MPDYGRVTDRILERIVDIVGEENVVEGDDEYSRDETSLLEPRDPDLIAKPRTAGEISEILRLANEEGIPITPRGAGTGLSAGAVPLFGGILLSLERMDEILEVDEENFAAVVEPGVQLADLYEAVEGRGLYYPLYPGEETATVGGNVATNAGGMRAVKHGVTRDNVLGLTAVLPTGEIVEAGGKYVKSSTGYDLRHLLIGSEGTLGIIAEIILKLTAPPGRREILIAPFERLGEGIRTAPDILREGIVPTGIEFIQRTALETSESFTGISLPLPGASAYLIIILEADGREEMRELVDSVTDVCIENGARDVFVPATEGERDDVMEVREKMYYAIQELGPVELADVVVPRSEIPKFMEMIEGISERHGIPIDASGHAGDGNVHIHIIGGGMEEGKFREKSGRVLGELFEAGASLGGTISGEHGLGSEKRDYLPIGMEEEQIEIMRKIKGTLDPNGIMNPGKVIPKP